MAMLIFELLLGEEITLPNLFFFLTLGILFFAIPLATIIFLSPTKNSARSAAIEDQQTVKVSFFKKPISPALPIVILVLIGLIPILYLIFFTIAGWQG